MLKKILISAILLNIIFTNASAAVPVHAATSHSGVITATWNFDKNKVTLKNSTEYIDGAIFYVSETEKMPDIMYDNYDCLDFAKYPTQAQEADLATFGIKECASVVLAENFTAVPAGEEKDIKLQLHNLPGGKYTIFILFRTAAVKADGDAYVRAVTMNVEVGQLEEAKIDDKKLEGYTDIVKRISERLYL